MNPKYETDISTIIDFMEMLWSQEDDETMKKIAAAHEANEEVKEEVNDEPKD